MEMPVHKKDKNPSYWRENIWGQGSKMRGSGGVVLKTLRKRWRLRLASRHEALIQPSVHPGYGVFAAQGGYVRKHPLNTRERSRMGRARLGRGCSWMSLASPLLPFPQRQRKGREAKGAGRRPQESHSVAREEKQKSPDPTWNPLCFPQSRVGRAAQILLSTQGTQVQGWRRGTARGSAAWSPAS